MSEAEKTTWIFDADSFVPSAKLVGENSYSIVSDYLGTPCQAYSENGNKVWEYEQKSYGGVENSAGAINFVPFRYQGQYEDQETGLYYNRFRYYSPEEGSYISQDPIGLHSKELNLYSYVKNSNYFIDVFGLTQSTRTDALPKNLQRRPKFTKATKDYLDKNTPKDTNGNFLDAKTQEPITGKKVIGHQNESWREYQENPANATKTRKQVIADYNDVSNLGYENKSSSDSDGGKLKGHEH